jgi:hypothetical protein
MATGDRRARPAPEVLQALPDYTLLRRDQNGWVELTSDGEQMWVEVERRQTNAEGKSFFTLEPSLEKLCLLK